MANAPSSSDIQKIINQLRDIEGNYKSLIEKLSKTQFEADEMGLKIVSEKISQACRQAPENASAIDGLIRELDALRQEAA